MKLNTLLKTATILACLICSCNNLKHQEQLNIEAEYEHLKLEHELLKSELSDMVERQNSISKIKEIYIKAAKAKNKHIKQDELD